MRAINSAKNRLACGSWSTRAFLSTTAEQLLSFKKSYSNGWTTGKDTDRSNTNFLIYRKADALACGCWGFTSPSMTYKEAYVLC